MPRASQTLDTMGRSVSRYIKTLGDLANTDLEGVPAVLAQARSTLAQYDTRRHGWKPAGRRRPGAGLAGARQDRRQRRARTAGAGREAHRRAGDAAMASRCATNTAGHGAIGAHASRPGARPWTP